MHSNDKWYVRNASGKVFGPIGFETLKAWVRDGRVEPLAGISEDLEHWILAPLKPELEMNWIVENNPGQFYGPTHRAVVDDFIKAGTLSKGARFYFDDHGAGATAQAALKAEHTALETAHAALETEHAALKAAHTALEVKYTALEVKYTALEAKCPALEAEHTALQSERDALKAALADARQAAQEAERNAADARARTEEELLKIRREMEALKAKIEEQEKVHAREWKTEVLLPEVVVCDEPPPSTARSAFGPAGSFAHGNAAAMAELERQAQAELARMGASGAKGFFGFGKKK